jgi:hypothetical protein
VVWKCSLRRSTSALPRSWSSARRALARLHRFRFLSLSLLGLRQLEVPHDADSVQTVHHQVLLRDVPRKISPSMRDSA